MSNEVNITRGFVTLAVGSDRYYQFARNMLRSFRMRHSEYPMAIICDRENEYTKEFDKVVIIDEENANYLAKFRILIDSPYDESIFIEPDCLIYHNIDHFFDLLSGGCDFTSFGWNDGPLDPWFAHPGKFIARFGEKVRTIPAFCPGYFFIRKSAVCEKIYEDIFTLIDWLTENAVEENPDLMCHSNLRDDPLFFIAMKMNDCICEALPEQGKCVNYYRVKKVIKISMRKGIFDVLQEKEYDNCNLMHFSTKRCIEDGLYPQQCLSLNMCRKNYPVFLISLVESKAFGAIMKFCKKVKYSIVHRISK